MVQSFRQNGRMPYRRGSSWVRHDHVHRQSSNTASLAKLSRQLEINHKTIVKWRKRTKVEDLRARPKAPHSTALSESRRRWLERLAATETVRNFVRETGLLSDDKTIPEDHGELVFCLTPFPQRPFLFV